MIETPLPEAPSSGATEQIGAVAIFWRHDAAFTYDWIKISDVLPDVPRVDLMASVLSDLVEYAAQKRRRVMDGDGPDRTPEQIDAMSAADMEAFSDELHAYSKKLTGHQAWIAEHAFVLSLPKTLSEEQVKRHLNAFGSLLLSLP